MVCSVPDVAVKVTQNATDFVVGGIMKPYEIHKETAHLIGSSFQQVGRLTASRAPVNDLLQSTAKSGGNMLAEAVAVIDD